jgi:hypothetical protein
VFHAPGAHGPAGGRPAFQAAGVGAGECPPGGDTIVADDQVIDADAQVRAALDTLWILTSPDAYTKLATQRGWSRGMWENTMTEVIRRLIT